MGLPLQQMFSNLPPFARRQALALLFRTTAAAFQRDMPQLRGLSREESLREYARLTTQWAEAALADGEDLSELQERLFRKAYCLGRVTGLMLGARQVSDVIAAGHTLYEILDIELHGTGSGEITVSSCYFSRFYRPEVCRVMSAMDRGLFAGLAGKGDLEFTQRITEGHTCCRARFLIQGSSRRLF